MSCAHRNPTMFFLTAIRIIARPLSGRGREPLDIMHHLVKHVPHSFQVLSDFHHHFLRNRMHHSQTSPAISNGSLSPTDTSRLLSFPERQSHFENPHMDKAVRPKIHS